MSAANRRGMLLFYLSRNWDSSRRKARPDCAAGGPGGEFGDHGGDQSQDPPPIPQARHENRAARWAGSFKI